MGVVDDLVRARRTYEKGDWASAFAAWSEVDDDLLTDDDLAGLAMAAYLVGHYDAGIHALQRCFHARVADGRLAAAARCAFWLGMASANAAERAVAGGWAARARRLLDELDEDVVERGYLRILDMFGHISRGEYPQIAECAGDITEYGRRFDNADLLAMGLSSQGRVSLYQGAVPQGLALFDEAMIGIAAKEVSPPLAGEVYCSMIEGCQEVSDFGRAAQWTAALSRWCDAQPGLLTFTGQCAVHRGQIMKLQGAYCEALEEFAAAAERYRALGTLGAAGLAHAERGDVLRLQGRYAEAETAYEQASDHGFEPQPGLALLWLARGRTDAARAAVIRLLAETELPPQRSRLLPSAVEVLLVTGETERARSAAQELREIADSFRCTALLATSAQVDGRLALETGDPAGALPYLRKASQTWAALQCPYEVARTRVLIGRACAAHGDTESSAREYEAARRLFAELGAAPALDELTVLCAPAHAPGALTDREIEVLRLVAAGKSNAQIATTLVLSQRTVARHLSNIFTKIDVPSRTAAAAYAYEHGLA